MRLRFSDCVFDSDTREVVRQGRALALAPKAFELLHVLIRERPRAISKQRLQQELWPNSFVTEANLANLIADLRAALGDHAKKPHIIRTVQRFGYAFHADEASAEGADNRPPVVRLIWNGREITLSRGDNILGRDETAVAWIDVHSVSRHHAKVVVCGDSVTIQDLGSKNGTSVNGRRISITTPLADGDTIRLGTAELVFRRFSRDASTGTVQSSD